jgi:DNA-binding NtrC family response regulator
MHGKLGLLHRLRHNKEKQAILNAMRACGGNRSQAARRLGISRNRLYRRVGVLGIDLPAASDEGTSSVGLPSCKLNDMLREVEFKEIVGVLRLTGGQRTVAARTLGISRSQFYRHVFELNIDLGSV